jgi:hypothetical protein
MEASAHGKYLEWVQDNATQLWKLAVVRGEGGVSLVPRPVALMEFALKAASGHPSVPKGGRAEYRDGPWYKTLHGKGQGARMQREKRARVHRAWYCARLEAAMLMRGCGAWAVGLCESIRLGEGRSRPGLRVLRETAFNKVKVKGKLPFRGEKWCRKSTLYRRRAPFCKALRSHSEFQIWSKF